ncbi:MAG: DUF1957 domain-containing protein [Acidobacteria bacterium]|nr:DUF1957 domain-containing protein [Acidobacteriota bacterium]
MPDIRQRLRSRNQAVRDTARREVATTLAACDGHVEEAALKLGLSASTVRRWSGYARTAGQQAAARPAPSSTASFPATHSADSPARAGKASPATHAGQRDAGGPAAEALPGPELAHRPRVTPEDMLAAHPVTFNPRPRALSFVLHTHLPWLLGHGSWPHGEDWLAEAVIHSYLPLIEVFERLRDEGLRNLLTLSITPILASQLADPRARDLVDRYFEQRLEASRATVPGFTLAAWWAERYEGTRATWRRLNKDIVGALAGLARDEVIELATCAATHAYLPLAHTQQLISLEMKTAVDVHERLFGIKPEGAWLPECAYRPGGAWRHPVTGARETFRPGLETFLAAAGIKWTVVDTHLVLGGKPGISSAGESASELAVVEGAVAEAIWIGASNVAAFVREPRSALQVWSRDHGYPGDARYLDFHKRHWPSGLRFWRVTHPRADLADKKPYDPAAADDAVRAHADHFVSLVTHLAGLDDGVAVCPFDTELFGHWWFEGPQWLEHVLRQAAAHPSLSPTSAGHQLRRDPPRVRLSLPEGSWGEGGDHRVWVNPATESMWHELGSSEFAVNEACLRPARLKLKRAILNQLMILAASDWPFLVTTGAARDYAEERFAQHRERLQQLLAAPVQSRSLPSWAIDDMAFPHLNPHWWEAR